MAWPLSSAILVTNSLLCHSSSLARMSIIVVPTTVRAPTTLPPTATPVWVGHFFTTVNPAVGALVLL